MLKDKVDVFCDWWQALTPAQLPQPAATAIEENKHRHYYAFAHDLKAQWADCGPAFHKLFASEGIRVATAVQAAATELLGWFDGVAKPTLLKILTELRNSSDILSQAFGDLRNGFARRSLLWLDELRSMAANAAKTIEYTPPYLTLGVQAGRPEVPLRYSTGLWTTDQIMGNWPWRDLLTVRDCLGELKEFGGDFERAMILLTRQCEQHWLAALKRLPEATTTVQSEVARSHWTAAHVLAMVLDSREGRLTRAAHDWAQQLLGPFQPWYTGLGGKEDLRPDRSGVLQIEPIRVLNTAFVPPDPDVTYFASSHVRYYCLFLRFLVERVVSGVATARNAPFPKIEPGRVGRVKAPTVADCLIDVAWSEHGYIATLGTRNAPAQRVISRLPVHVVRMLRVVGQVALGVDEKPSHKPGDPSRFREWFRACFDVSDGSDPLPLVTGTFTRAWQMPHKKSS